MKRRTIVRAAGVAAAGALSGCVERLRALELSTPVPIRIVNETDTPRNVSIEAFSLEDGRATYEEAVNVQPDQRADLGHLDTERQRVRVTAHDPDVTEEATVGDSTQSVRVTIVGDDELDLTVNRRE